MRIIDRFDKYMAYSGLNDNKVTVACALSVGLLGKARSGKSDLGKAAIEKVLKQYQNLNKVWLLTGEGEMLKNTNSENTKAVPEYEVYLLPVSAQGGSLSEFAESVELWHCERIVSPVKGADFAITVTGDSMSPEYPSGCKILIKKINHRSFLEWGRCYVLDTCNGSVIKKIMPADDESKVKCVSVNPEFPPFEVSKEDIFGFYRVMMMLSEK